MTEKYIRAIAAPLMFVFIFYLVALYLYPSNYYIDRDDGVITLSHAKNWVDFGFIGVSPSGARIEGYSAPLQMLLYSLIYLLSGVSYSAFSAWSTVLLTFAIGWITSTLFKMCGSTSQIQSTAWTAALALTLPLGWPFTGWHLSGMENPLLHAAYLLLVLVVSVNASKERIHTKLALLVFAIAIVRIDSIVYVVPIVTIGAIAHSCRYRNLSAFRGLLTLFILIIIFNLVRKWYFGAFTPNTGIAQNIDVVERAKRILSLDLELYASHKNIVKHIVNSHLIWLLVPNTLLFVYTMISPRTTSGVPRASIVAFYFCTTAFLIGSALTPLAFGVARLDPARTTTFAYVISLTAFFWLLITAHLNRLIKGGIVVLFFGVLVLRSQDPSELCCSILGVSKILGETTRFTQESGVHRATIATPDLGKLSYAKQGNIVDLGYLGSPILAHLKNRHDIVRVMDYLFDYTAPDIIEVHGGWACFDYEQLFLDPRFKERYEVVEESRGTFLKTQCSPRAHAKNGIYRRKALLNQDDAETILVKSLQTKLDVKPVKEAINACRLAQPNPKKDCLWIGRSVYRLLPEIREHNLFDSFYATMADSPSSQYDLAIMRSFKDGKWFLDALGYIQTN